ncbi:SDR family oxidoreductase [Balneolaceae bacterium ANBcel3]|nr:SDR family oxidoreductase [Balneolaceae bacterium ANBcel3]
MKVLFIGGTGNISTAVSRLCIKKGMELYLLNRGNRPVNIDGANVIQGDYHNPEQLKALMDGYSFDCVVNWIAFTPEHVQRDVEIFRDKTSQYIFISSASAYQKPGGHPVITESTPLYNPYWSYSRDKIACEEYLNAQFREHGFPVTIVRPSHTYDMVIPVSLGSWEDFTIIERMRRGEEVIIHGDGTSLWTLTHSDDFAIGFAGLIGHQQACGHSFHITSDEILNWNQIYEAIAEAAGAPLKAVHIPSDFISSIDKNQTGNLLGDKAQSVIFDNSKIKRFVPDYKAVIPFRQGIKRSIEWFDADPKRRKILPENDAMLDRILAQYKGKMP